jgi:uncharacterized membrane protein
MRSRLSMLGGHPVHVMVVPFAMATFAVLLVFDALAWIGTSVPDVGPLATAGVGFAGTVVAILTGLVDLAAIPDESDAHTTAALHFTGGLVLLALYALAGYAVQAGWAAAGEPLLIGVNAAGLAAVGVQGWLGGELVVRHRIGILEDDEGADPVDLS